MDESSWIFRRKIKAVANKGSAAAASTNDATDDMPRIYSLQK